jgi:AcrR family transcriptional regulator
MYAKHEEKRALILKAAEKVFLKKGYASVTMADIVKAGGVSRGGLYFYFSSVGEILIQVILARNITNHRRMQAFIDAGESFSKLLDEFFAFHKHRLLHMQNSLRPAILGYFLAYREQADHAFLEGQFENAKAVILNILKIGQQNAQLAGDADILADYTVFLIEGMTSRAMTAGIAEAAIDRQFALLRQTLVKHDE